MRFEAKYDLTPEDAVGSWRMHRKHQGHVRLPFPEYVLPFSGAVGVAIAFRYGMPAGALVLAAGCFYSAPLFYEWWLRFEARRHSTERVAIVLTDDGITITTSAGAHHHAWREVLKVLIDDWGLVFYGGWGFVFVPSRAFVSGFRRHELREFVTQHLKNG